MVHSRAKPFEGLQGSAPDRQAGLEQKQLPSGMAGGVVEGAEEAELRLFFSDRF